MGSLTPLALSIAPEVARLLFGVNAATTTSAIEGIIHAVTGTTDAEAAAISLQQNPKLASELRLRLAQYSVTEDQIAHSADLAEIKAVVMDRPQPAPTSVAGGLATPSWATFVISAVVLLSFGLVVGLVLIRGVSSGSETAANMLLGTLAAMATSVVSYWVGSSAGSARKDERLAQIPK